MMKKKISVVLAFLMAASMLAGCKKTEEGSAGIPDTGTMPSITQMTTASEETEPVAASEDETSESETTEATETESESETSETTVPEETTTASETPVTTVPTETTTVKQTATAAAASETAKKEWSETEISETLYITTDCYSRVKAIVGSESVKKYTKGTKINVVAATDTGYYKLADGTFIHSDYVSDKAPDTTTTSVNDQEIFDDEPLDETTAATTKKKTETTTQKDPDSDKNTSSKPLSSTYNKSYTERYPYKQLSESEKTLYANIVEAAESFQTKVEIPDGLDSDKVFKVYALVFNNEPQLFWLSPVVPNGIGSMNLKFAMNRSQAEEMQATIDANVKEVMTKVNGYSSTVSKLKVIHDWVITHNVFSLENTFATCGVYNGLSGNGILQCQGYAKSILYLCDVAGIECMTVTGNNSEGATHAWNVVYCTDGYYILDATWDDPENSYGKASYVRYLFFLANDDMISGSHLNKSTMTRTNGTRVKLYDPPTCSKTACYYFKAYNKEYKDFDSALEGMYDEFDDVIAAGKQVVHVRVPDHATWEKLNTTEYWRLFQNYAISKSSKVKNILRQNTELPEDVLVVEYDIVYK